MKRDWNNDSVVGRSRVDPSTNSTFNSILSLDFKEIRTHNYWDQPLNFSFCILSLDPNSTTKWLWILKLPLIFSNSVLK